MAKSFPFPRKMRICADADFNKILRGIGSSTQKRRTNYFALFFQRNTLSYPRIGISISKKNVKNATQRNRLRRIAKETFRLKQQDLNNFDMILIIYKNADQLSNDKWRNVFEAELAKLTTGYTECKQDFRIGTNKPEQFGIYARRT